MERRVKRRNRKTFRVWIFHEYFYEIIVGCFFVNLDIHVLLYPFPKSFEWKRMFQEFQSRLFRGFESVVDIVHWFVEHLEWMYKHF